MRTSGILLKRLLPVLIICFSIVCEAASQENALVFTGSTPGDAQIKRILRIPEQTTVDFIQWNLVLEKDHQFTLAIHYGESQPNTLGFKNGGRKYTTKGSYKVSSTTHFKELYHLQASDLVDKISLVKLSENVLHLVTPAGEFMNGNGGWSYSLNRKKAIESNTIMIRSSDRQETAAQVIYDGRTPCREIAAEHPEMKVSAGCFKLKWQLILNRDPITYKPTTFSIRKVIDGKAQQIYGKWTIQKGTGALDGQIMYIIEPDKPAESISFLVADAHVLFFLNKMNQPYIGNSDFGFAMNRKL